MQEKNTKKTEISLIS